MSLRSTSARIFAPAAFTLLVLSLVTPALAAPEPSPDALLPWFAIELDGDATEAIVSVINASAHDTRIEVAVYTNWGIPVLSVEALLDETEPRSFDLARWIVDGVLPDRTLAADELAHVQAALSGAKSPRDGLFYATAVAPSLATGYVVIRAIDPPDGKLAGDAFFVRNTTGTMSGAPLTALGAGLEASCSRHAIRIPDAARLAATSRLAVWTGARFEPSSTPTPSGAMPHMTVKVYDATGNPTAQCDETLVATQLVEICGAGAPIGWLEVVTDVPAEIVGMMRTADASGFETAAFCLPDALDLVGPELEVTLRVNDGGTDGPPGTLVAAGDAIELTYEVTNPGDAPIDAITVADRWIAEVSCPGSTLGPDETMTCRASSIARPCRHEHVAWVTARTSDGSRLEASDSAWYSGTQVARISVESRIDGDDADTQPGPTIDEATAFVLTYEITNLGDAPLAELEVAERGGFAVTCPKQELAPGESIVCSAAGVASRGQHELLATVKASSACRRIEASDATHYFGQAVEPAIEIVKTVDGFDANTPPGPSIPNGQAIEFRFVVTNVGTTLLTDVTVVDDVLGAIACPATTLDVAASMTCSVQTVALACAHANVATVTATSPLSTTVTDADAANYFGTTSPALSLETLVNGDSADSAPGPVIAIGAQLLFSYVVTNGGDVPLSLVGVADDEGGDVACPKTALQPGESMTCTLAGSSAAGPHAHVATATGTPPCGDAVSASDPAYYYGLTADISLETLVNGEEADAPPGPSIATGAQILWTFVVTNGGSGPLTSATVTADSGLAVTCPKTTLAAGESMTCTASSTAIAGQQSVMGIATGTPEAGPLVSWGDPASYLGFTASVALETLTNGNDADLPPGPTLLAGSTVQWTYVVTNTGSVSLTSVAVTDDKGVTVTCPKTALAAGESMTCTASGTAVAGQYANIGTVAGTALGTPVSASDPSHYYGSSTYQGCTPSYWKNHTANWPPTGYSPSQEVDTVFGQSALYPTLANSTLVTALGFAGGSGVSGAAEILLRAGTAALLNAAHPSVAYPLTSADVISQVNTALATQNRDTILTLAAQLDANNNWGCPLN